jgi:hypothetical protein
MRKGTQERRDAITLAISEYAKRGYPPTCREISVFTGIPVSVVEYYLDILKQDGLITKEPNRARTIRLVEER